MIIGQGPLELGVLGFGHNGDLSYRELSELIKNALSFHPLNKIFRVSLIERFSVPESVPAFEFFDKSDANRIMCERKNLDLLIIVKKGVIPEYDDDGLIYSDTDPSSIAHEIGHALGLKHHGKCQKCRSEDIKCEYYGEIMCPRCDEICSGFREEDVKKLEEDYLK